MARATVLMPVQVVTAIMSLAMTPLALVVVLVVLDHAEGSELPPPSLAFPVQINSIHPIDSANVLLLGVIACRLNFLNWVI